MVGYDFSNKRVNMYAFYQTYYMKPYFVVSVTFQELQLFLPDTSRPEQFRSHACEAVSGRY